MSGQPEAITEAELAAALAEKLRRCGGTHLIVTDSPAVAADIFEAALSLREPEYEPAVAYVDARGDIYLRSSIGDWVSYSGSRHADAVPVRPLRRLVPEGGNEGMCPGGC